MTVCRREKWKKSRPKGECLLMVRTSQMVSIRDLKVANTVSSNCFCFESKLLSEVGQMLCKTRRKLLYAQQWENNFLTVYENIALF